MLPYKSLKSRAPVMYLRRRRSECSSSYIIKHYTSGLTEYQGLSHIGNAGNYRQEEMTTAHTPERIAPAIHKSAAVKANRSHSDMQHILRF